VFCFFLRFVAKKVIVGEAVSMRALV
jgi:hypothetical protein